MLDDEVIDYEQWLWDREKAIVDQLIEERWELMEVASKCPFKVCPCVNDENELSSSFKAKRPTGAELDD